MFITAVCGIFLVKLRWPKTKSLYDTLIKTLKHAMFTLDFRKKGKMQALSMHEA